MAKRFLTDIIARFLGIGGATGDATNPLSVRGPGALFDGNTTGHQIRVNKAALGDTGSLLFQTGFSGRAEFGLVSSDNFQLKVSDAGVSFTTVWEVAADTGITDFKVRPTILGETALKQGDTALDVRFSGLGLGGATPDGTNRFAINTTAALFNNAGTNINLVLNKATAGQDASVTLQSGFNTRALFGLLGNDNLTFKVTPDGSTFHDGFILNKDDGSMQTPGNSTFSASVNYDFYIGADAATVVSFNNAEHNDNGDFNSATGVFTAPVAGQYEFHASIFYKINGANPAVETTLQMYVNGTAIPASRGWTQNDFGNSVYHITSRMSKVLAAGDTVDVRATFKTYDGYVEADTNTFFGRYLG